MAPPHPRLAPPPRQLQAPRGQLLARPRLPPPQAMLVRGHPDAGRVTLIAGRT